MLRHIFITSVNEGVSNEQIDEIVSVLSSLSEQISEIVHLTVGRNMGLFDEKENIALVADFKNESDWKSYMENPDHLQIGERISVFLDTASQVVMQIQI